MRVWQLRSAQKPQIPGPLRLLAAQQSPTSLYLHCPPSPFTKCPTHSDHCWPLTITQRGGLAEQPLCVVTDRHRRTSPCLQTEYVKMEHVQQVWWWLARELRGHWGVIFSLDQGRRSCSRGSIPRKNQGGHSAVPLLLKCPRDWSTAETDGFLQVGRLHLWQLRAAVQWSCR